jgi:hypothetical protein
LDFLILFKPKYYYYFLIYKTNKTNKNQLDLLMNKKIFNEEKEIENLIEKKEEEYDVYEELINDESLIPKNCYLTGPKNGEDGPILRLL